jgi:hypothetical protein
MFDRRLLIPEKCALPDAAPRGFGSGHARRREMTLPPVVFLFRHMVSGEVAELDRSATISRRDVERLPGFAHAKMPVVTFALRTSHLADEVGGRPTYPACRQHDDLA